MDKELFLQRLRDLPLEEGRAYIREYIADLADYDAVGNMLADEARRLLYTPFVSLKVAEVLISFGDYAGHMPSRALGLKAKGDALMAVGHFRAAMDSLDAARDEFRLLGDEGNAARSRISWIISATWTGRVEEGLQEAARARDVFLRLGESYWVRVIDSNTALIYDYVGRHQDAANLYEGMLAIYAVKSDHPINRRHLRARIRGRNSNHGCRGAINRALVDRLHRSPCQRRGRDKSRPYTLIFQPPADCLRHPNATSPTQADQRIDLVFAGNCQGLDNLEIRHVRLHLFVGRYQPIGKSRGSSLIRRVSAISWPQWLGVPSPRYTSSR